VFCVAAADLLPVTGDEGVCELIFQPRIFIFGALLIMMGQNDRSEALFYCFRLEGQVPATHLLRLIEKQVSSAFVRERLKQSCSETGRPSIDPDLLQRILLIGYSYGIISQRTLVEDCTCIWRGAGLLAWDLISRSRIPRFQESSRPVPGIEGARAVA